MRKTQHADEEKTTQMRQKNCLKGLSDLDILINTNQVQQTYVLLSFTKIFHIYPFFMYFIVTMPGDNKFYF